MPLIREFDDFDFAGDDSRPNGRSSTQQIETEFDFGQAIDEGSSPLAGLAHWIVGFICTTVVLASVFFTFAGSTIDVETGFAHQKVVLLRGDQVKRLEPGAPILRDGRIVGEVTEVGYENGLPIAELDFEFGQRPTTDEQCVVESDGSFFSQQKIVEIKNRNTSQSDLQFLDAGPSNGLEIPQLLIGLFAVGVIVGVGLFVMKVIQKSFFWIALALVVIAVLYILLQHGISLPEFPNADFSVPLPFEE